ncbi:sporulation-delaying protein SdpB family protein [Nonomuraea insulae]|uniref:Sporulation-delaying protein SdpB family protein n=1 Tax=Nonomuraea insulae TaxID=1616787 RepID=A0ABW1CH50_9ACTN
MGLEKIRHHHAFDRGQSGGAVLTAGLARAGIWIRSRLDLSATAWTSMVGLVRTLLALGTLGTLLATPAPVLLSPLAGGVRPPVCSGAGMASIWCVLPAGGGEVAKWASVAILLLVASGWCPRITAIPHWWVSWSFINSVTIQDGGDQVTAVLTLLLIPVALTDRRRWHWSRSTVAPGSEPVRMVATVTLLLIRIQVLVLYLHAGLAKLGVPEWVDGSAMYYWFRSVIFGAPPLLRPLLDVLTDVPILLALLTWGSIAIEVLLGVALFMPRRARYVLLASGLLFHEAIAASMGLWSFDMAMSAALILYLTPQGSELNGSVLRRIRGTLRADPQPVSTEIGAEKVSAPAQSR